jgi:hypothetical protein
VQTHNGPAAMVSAWGRTNDFRGGLGDETTD